MSAVAIVDARVLTMDDERRDLERATVLVEDGEIVAVGSNVEIPVGSRVIEAAGHAVIPGLVNAHTHVPQILLRGGYSHDRPLYEWLYNVLYPGLSVYENDDIRCATLLFATEALMNGVTTIVDNEDAGTRSMVSTAASTVEALVESGIRAVYARMFADQPAPGFEDYLGAVRAKAPDVPDSDIFVDTDRVLADLDGALVGGGVTPSGTINADPKFVGGDPYDYHLQATSPAKDAGPPEARYFDHDGTRNDLGMFGGHSYLVNGKTTNKPIVLGLQAAPIAVPVGGIITIQSTGAVPK